MKRSIVAAKGGEKDLSSTQANEQPVLVVYDIRGIQDFVFRTNRVKDIVGASAIVADVLENSIKGWFEQQGNIKEFVFEWFDSSANAAKPFLFRDDPGIQAEVLYIGGGNAYAAYRSNALAMEAGAWIARKILRDTHTLSLASASVYMTDNYLEDQRALMERLARIKAEGRMPRPSAGFPFTIEELGSGLPCVSRDGGDRISAETRHKRRRYEHVKKAQEAKDSGAWQYELEFDSMVLQKGRNSLLAVVHLDGNNLGQGIKERLEKEKEYSKAVEKMRRISLNITSAFQQGAFDEMLEKFGSDARNFDESNPIPFRPIIRAGDDLTFVCRANLAMELTRRFLVAVGQYSLDGKVEPGQSAGTKGFSACAGIAYVNSHFPFSQAYDMAESLCKLAKDKAKAKAAKSRRPVGSYVDFHLNYSGNIEDIKTLREREYVLYESGQKPLKLLQRPYRMDNEGMDNEGKEAPDHYTQLKKKTEHLCSDKAPRKWIKEARDAYHVSKAAVDNVFNRAGSLEGRSLYPGWMEDKVTFKNEVATMYDALEMFDILSGLAEETP